jgi:hypothetical protein
MGKDPKEYYHNKGQQDAGGRDYKPPHGIFDDLTTWSSDGMRQNTEENKAYDQGYFSSRGQSDGAANSYKPPSDADSKEAYDEAWQASYDERHKGGCYLSEACCAFAGLPDNCYELTVLRQFRDRHLLASAEGRAIVCEYYDMAPRMVEDVRRSPHASAHWQFVFERVVHTVELIDGGRADAAVAAYIEMVKSLKGRLRADAAA